MKQIKTIAHVDPVEFDKQVNAALLLGYTLLRRGTLPVNQEKPLLLAELEIETTCATCGALDYCQIRRAGSFDCRGTQWEPKK